MAAREEAVEALVGHRARLCHRCLLQLGHLFAVARLASQPVDPFAVRGRHQPRAGVVGDAGARPVLERGDQCVLNALLREVEVAKALHERRGEPARLLVEDGGHRVARDRDQGPCTTIGRTSTSPPGQLFATAMALSRSSTSMSAKPPTVSFDSMNGPSMAFIAPFTRLTDVALRCIPSSPPPLMTPVFDRSSHHFMSGWYALSSSSFDCLSCQSSLATNMSMYFGISRPPPRVRVVRRRRGSRSHT